MSHRPARALILCVVAAIITGCDYLGPGYTPIKEIVAAPATFEGKEVRLKGRVKDITRIPLIELKSFVLNDGSGDITVTTQGNLPALNDDIALTGSVSSAAIIGGQSIGLYVKEIKRLR